MRPASRSYRALLWARHVAMLLMLVACADVALDKGLGVRLLPDAAEVAVCLLALLLGLLSLALEPTEHEVRRVARAEGLALAQRLEEERRVAEQRSTRRTRVERVLEGNDFPRMVFQPIADVQTGTIAGYEALSRFSVGRPDEWFAQAAAVGLGLELELKAIRRALVSLPSLPGTAYLSVNASPQTLASEQLREVLADLDLRRVVLELTEQYPVTDYPSLRRAVAHLRSRGGRLAIDDLGSDYASLRHVATLEPDIIKLDGTFTRALSSDGPGRSLVAALVGMGHAVGASIVAEGLEDESGLLVVRELGVQAAQGWFIGRPQPLARLGEATRLPVPRSV